MGYPSRGDHGRTASRTPCHGTSKVVVGKGGPTNMAPASDFGGFGRIGVRNLLDLGPHLAGAKPGEIGFHHQGGDTRLPWMGPVHSFRLIISSGTEDPRDGGGTAGRQDSQGTGPSVERNQGTQRYLPSPGNGINVKARGILHLWTTIEFKFSDER